MSDDLTFASAGVAGVHYARCWACMTGSHYPKPTWHTWADDDDVAHADATSQPDPTHKRCACPCVDDSEFCATHAYPEPEIVTIVSLDGGPCATCGESGPCGYDAEGRPMIHSDDGEEQPC